jgi:hypothetical protein
VWVDPRTGIPIKYDQNIRSTVETPDGRGRMIVAQARLITVDRDQVRNVESSDDYAFKARLVKTIIPVGGLAGGLALLAVGSLVAMRGGRGGRGGASDGGLPGTAFTRRPDGRFGTMSHSSAAQS